MFSGSTTIKVSLYREAGGSRIHVENGRWSARDTSGQIQRFSWHDRVMPNLAVFDVEWAASWNAWAPAPVDTATPPRWEISLRTTNAATVYRVDVTARRLQQFQPAGQYSWWNVQNNTVVESGQVTANAAGVLTVPAFLVTSAGNRLVVF